MCTFFDDCSALTRMERCSSHRGKKSQRKNIICYGHRQFVHRQCTYRHAGPTLGCDGSIDLGLKLHLVLRCVGGKPSDCVVRGGLINLNRLLHFVSFTYYYIQQYLFISPSHISQKNQDSFLLSRICLYLCSVIPLTHKRVGCSQS